MATPSTTEIEILQEGDGKITPKSETALLLITLVCCYTVSSPTLLVTEIAHYNARLVLAWLLSVVTLPFINFLFVSALEYLFLLKTNPYLPNNEPQPEASP